MNEKHNHQECKHKDLKFCEKCSVVYCATCEEEWVKNYMVYTNSNITWHDNWPYVTSLNHNHIKI